LSYSSVQRKLDKQTLLATGIITVDTCRTGRKVVLFNWREYATSSKNTLINFAGFISMQWVYKILPSYSSAGKLGGSVVMFTFHNWNIDWIQMLAVPTGIIAMLLGSYGSHMYQPIDTNYKEVNPPSLLVLLNLGTFLVHIFCIILTLISCCRWESWVSAVFWTDLISAGVEHCCIVSHGPFCSPACSSHNKASACG
jgi:hypothetical protein